MGTKNNPGAFDCYANAEPDEPIFVLLGRDRIGGSLARLWAVAREQMGEEPPKVAESHDCAATMDAWCREVGKQPADVLDLLPFEMLKQAIQRRGAVVKLQVRDDMPAAEAQKRGLAATLVLTGKQVKELLEFTAPDESEEQLNAEVSIGFGDADAHSGPGLYAWSTEYPEESAIALFDTTGT